METETRARRGAVELSETELQGLREAFEWAVEKRDSNVLARAQLNYRTRHCVWRNQSPDGKRWRSDRGKQVKPWPGASDARVHLIDKYIKEDNAFLMTVWRRMRTVVSGVETNDAAFGQRLTNYLRWQKYTQMRGAAREHRLLANYFLERGVGVMGVFWDRQQQLGYEEIDLEMLMQQAAQAQEILGSEEASQLPPEAIVKAQMLAELPAMIMDPAMEEQVVAFAQTMYPDVQLKSLKRGVKELRTQGHTRLPRPFTKRQGPCVVALALNEDIFYPPEMTDLQTSSGPWRRELLTDTQLRERVLTHQWDPKWVEAMIASQRGKMSIDLDPQWKTMSAVGRTATYMGGGEDDTRKLFEVVHGFRRMADEEGVPGIYYTCFNPGLLRQKDRGRGKHDSAGYAYHDLLDYQHGEYPFINFEREVLSRRLEDSRGYGEVGSTWQNQIKAEWDGRIDRASIATLPPSFYPPGEAPDAWGPGVEIPTVRREHYGFMEIPKYDPGSSEVELSVRGFADEYFGRPTNEFNVTQAGVTRQDLADIFMEGCAEVDTQLLQLCQQFENEQFYFRVVGSSKGKSIKATREEIQGKFDVSCGYNVENLDQKTKVEKMKLLEQALTMDVNGIVDRDEALEVVFDLIDPNLGERVLRPAEHATQAEIEDEQNVFGRMYAGVDVDIKLGQAYGLRLQTLKQIMETNPDAAKKYAENEHFREIVDKRVKQLNHQLEQRENAQIGRLGG